MDGEAAWLPERILKWLVAFIYPAEARFPLRINMTCYDMYINKTRHQIKLVAMTLRYVQYMQWLSEGSELIAFLLLLER